MRFRVKQITAATCLAVISGSAASAGEWNGSYVGFYGGSVYNGSRTAVGFVAGHNWQYGSVVLGAEVDGFEDSSGLYEVFANARIGVPISEGVLVYGQIGAGKYINTLSLVGAGAGVEVKVSDRMSVRASFEKHNTSWNTVLTGPSFTKMMAIWNF